MERTIAILMTFLCVGVSAQHDTSVCSPVQDSGKPMPTLPLGYSVRTELNIVTGNQTIEAHEFYDKSQNMSAISMVQPSEETYAILNYNTNEFIYIYPAEQGISKQCEVKALDQLKFRLDLQTTESSIIRLTDALTYGKDSSIAYTQSGTLRGEKVQIWNACVYDQQMKATFNVTWYFSAVGWQTSSGDESIPIRMHLIGKTTDKDSGKLIPHERIYDFSEYNPSVPNHKVFELHSGSYCKGIKQKKKLPDTPMTFSYGLESISLGSGENIRSDLYMFYDAEKKLFRMDYTEPQEGALGYNKGPLSQIHDFNTGIGYLLYKNRGSCADPVPLSQMAEDSTAADSTHVRMKTSKEFFNLNKKNFIYQGERNVRGIDCNIWIDERTDWPQNNSADSLWEWSFSSDEVLANSGASTELSFPVSLEITQPANEIHLLHNIYGIEDDFQSYDKFDISMCFGDENRLDYQFSVHGSFKTIVRNQEDKFKSIVRNSLALYGGVSPLRISNIKLDYDSDDVIVYFTLLGLPKVEGDVKNVLIGSNLEDAAQKIVMGISSRKFTIDLGSGKTIAVQDSDFRRVNSIPSQQKGKYKPGDMAGIGLGMLLVGLMAGGILTAYIIRKRINDSFKAVKFDAQME